MPGLSETNPLTVTLALALVAESATLVAVTTCVPVAFGAVYKPEMLMVPSLAFPPPMPSTDHVTAVLVAPVTEAENCCAVPAAMVAVV